MDNELFKLCMSVYGIIGWNKELKVIRDDGAIFNEEDYGLVDGDYFVPLYTSDYLLEKLPYKVIGKYGDEMYGVSVNRAGNGWYAWYGELHSKGAVEDDGIAFIGFADTPLKALLKLTLALDDEGIKL